MTIKSNIPSNCRAISNISMPERCTTMIDDAPISLPRTEAETPRAVKVRAMPRQKKTQKVRTPFSIPATSPPDIGNNQGNAGQGTGG